MKDMTRNIESHVTEQGQTTLPKPVLEALGLKAGDRVRYFIADGEVRMVSVLPISRLFGALPYDSPPISSDPATQVKKIKTLSSILKSVATYGLSVEELLDQLGL